MEISILVYSKKGDIQLEILAEHAIFNTMVHSTKIALCQMLWERKWSHVAPAPTKDLQCGQKEMSSSWRKKNNVWFLKKN